MRRLLYIPIIHDEVDMGGAGVLLSRRSAGVAGAERWRLHGELVRRFWDAVASRLGRLDAAQVRIYQDGLPVGGATGKRIVETAADRGSANYRLVRELLQRGAELRKTEDPVLLLREHEGVVRALKPALPGDEGPAQEAQSQSSPLMERRDEFMAQTINGTLTEGELGVLFIGASHDVVSRLAPDICVQLLMEPGLVTAYFQELVAGHDDLKLERLAGRLLTMRRDVP